MREIKFRAWDKEGCTFIPAHRDLVVTCIDINGFNYPVLEKNYEYKNIILMQYTGLKDDNDKEIYFDDIVKIHFKDPDNWYRGTALVTETMSFGVGLLLDYFPDYPEKVWAVDQGGVMSDLWEDVDLWDIEVIGNIYQNKELLNAKI